MSDRQESRRELGEFLRRQRLRTRVADYGFPTGRRRTPGLRREEVAMLAEVSPSWYTHLEQGRDIRPSPEVLDRLGEVFGLDEHEVNYLHLLALGQRPFRGLRPAPPELVELAAELVRSHRYPAYLSNAAADVLAWNDHAVHWYTDFGELPADRRNLAWWMFTAPEARNRFVEFDTEARRLIDVMRGSLIRLEGFNRLSEVPLVLELLQVNELARECWRSFRVAEHAPVTRHLRREDGSSGSFRLLPLFELFGHDLGIMFHLPVEPALGPGATPEPV